MKSIRSYWNPCTFPEPVIGYAIEPRTQADVDKLVSPLPNWLKKILPCRYEPMKKLVRPFLRGMGELHLEIIIDRLKREFKVEINQGAPQVAYKEAIT